MTIPVKPAAGPKENLRTMQVLNATLLIGIIFFGGIVIILLSVKGHLLDNEPLLFSEILLYSAIGLATVCYFFARTIYNKKLETLKNSALPLADKLSQYRALLVLYLACCEGPALFSIVVLYLTGNFLVLIITICMMMAMAVKFPFTQKIISLLNVDWVEQQDLI